MAWLAVDKSGVECKYEFKPKRLSIVWQTRISTDKWSVLPKGSIEKLIGRKLTWEDNPVEI